MDNNKIGKLIAELRKKQGLTQQELGDMVGVGFKAVSKWECGTTLPDITIINEVSKILGITTDELLAGEINEPKGVEENNSNNKNKTKLVIPISIITILLLFIVSLFIYQNNNKTYTYNLVSDSSDEYYISGNAYLKKNKLTISVGEILFKDKEFSNMKIKNYEYNVILNNKLLFGYGYIDSMNFIEEPISIDQFLKNDKINFKVNINISNKDFIKSKTTIKFKFMTLENQIINKDVYIIHKYIK